MERFDEEAAIAAWLAAKYRISRSEKTLSTYRNIISRFRDWLREQGLSLNPLQGCSETAGDWEKRQVLGQFALKIQSWASAPSGRAVSNHSFNGYLSALSSFYQFCNRYDLLLCGDPVERIERAKVHRYAGSRALDVTEVAKRLGDIDRTEKKGCRDYALLATLFESGRRISEVLGMQWKHVTMRTDGSVEVFFPRTKGGKTKRDALSQATSKALLAWIRMEYGEKKPKASAPIWTSLSSRTRNLHVPLQYQSAREVMRLYLGTARLHQARHTWARAMKLLGASLEERRVGLGHSSALTTELYDAALSDAENPHREALARLFGIT
jgi:site-specific recombinase XerD